MIRPCGFLDNIWPLSASLLRKERRDELKKADGRLVIRDGQWQHSGIVKDGTWTAMRSAIQKANRIVLELVPEWEIATVTVEELEAGEASAWLKAGPEIAVHVPIVTNPLSRLFVGTVNAHVPVGDIVALDPMLWNSAINAGSTTRLHLVISLTKREANGE